MTSPNRNTDQPLVSLVIPAYNEENRIGSSLATIKKYIAQKDYRAEVIVVDDGSKDDTLAVAKASLDGCSRHLIIGYHENRGKGYALKQGIANATGRYIVFMDADLSTPIDQLDKLLPILQEGYDVVIGTRKNAHADVRKRQPFFREFLGKGFTLLSNVLLVKGISDITCGFKGFSKEAGQDIFRRQLIADWSFDAEILFIAQRLGYTIREMPVTWYDAAGTKVRLMKDIVGSLNGILRIRINSLRGLYGRRAAPDERMPEQGQAPSIPSADTD